MNHSKRFIGKPQRKLGFSEKSKKQNCSETFSRVHFTHSHTAQHICSASNVNFWSTSALWEVKSVNFTPVAVCTKSLFHKNCFISSGFPAESPHSKSKHLGRWTAPGLMLMSGTFWRRKMELHCMEIISWQIWGEKCFKTNRFFFFFFCDDFWLIYSIVIYLISINKVCAKFGVVFVYCCSVLLLCKVLWLNSV